MQKALCLSLALVLALALPAGSALAGPPQINTEAALAAFAIPTQDPCITGQATVDVLGDSPVQPARVTYQFVTHNTCTNQPVANAEPLQSPQPLRAGEFVVKPNHSGASLVLKSEARDTIAGATEPITVDLHWAKTPGVADGFATVAGTVSTDTLRLAFDESMGWHRWGSDSFPWAGLWKCVFPQPSAPPSLDLHKPGCIGQI